MKQFIVEEDQVTANGVHFYPVWTVYLQAPCQESETGESLTEVAEFREREKARIFAIKMNNLLEDAVLEYEAPCAEEG